MIYTIPIVFLAIDKDKYYANKSQWSVPNHSTTGWILRLKNTGLTAENRNLFLFDSYLKQKWESELQTDLSEDNWYSICLSQHTLFLHPNSLHRLEHVWVKTMERIWVKKQGPLSVPT